MMKLRLLLPIAALAASTVSMASTFSEEWYISGDSAYVDAVYKGEDSYGVVRSTVYPLRDGSVWIGFEYPVPESGCSRYENQSNVRDSITFNGVLVRMVAQCIDKQRILIRPKSDRARDLMISHFKARNSVSIEIDGIKLDFSAKGFTAVYRAVSSKRSGL